MGGISVALLMRRQNCFFCDVMMRALSGGRVFNGLIFHLQPFQVNDPNKRIVGLPNLALL